MNILQAIDDPAVFGPHFRDRQSWRGWRAFLAALFGLPMDAAAERIFRECTARAAVPAGGASEAWLVIGRRGGKSFILATIACFLACFRDWRPHLGPGERATIMVIAADRRQARVCMRYIKGLLGAVPMLSKTVTGETSESVDLRNGVVVEVHTASFRTVRGYTVAAALCDEIAFWRSDESANPDSEIIAALRPAMATVPGTVLLCASSPYARRGALWQAHRSHYGQDGTPVLVWQAPTRAMNPNVPQHVIDAAYADDPASAAAEYGAEFRSDIESFVSRDAVEACVDVGVRERAPLSGVAYAAFCDPSGGSADSMTLAVAHREGDRPVLDALRERRPPFSPAEVVSDFAALLRSYKVTRVTGDRYAGEWPRERFREHQITYEPAARPKSDLYRDALPLINSGGCALLNNARLVAQLTGLERRTARSGRDSIDHAPGAHDDLANAACGALVEVGRTPGYDMRALVGAPDTWTAGVRLAGLAN